tara:strand:+ start:1162 stop:2040 length:879 start_codon:yes stop_codon:yes gene_type:complete
MNIYCTLSDKNYLDRGLALYESLVQTSSDPFKLYYLCLDQESKETLDECGLDQIVPISLSSIEVKQDILDAKADRDRKQYIFTLASYFSDHLINSEDCEGVMYIDSDICFYKDPKVIVDACNNYHCGITLHRHNFIGHRDGGFNVGVVWFKNSHEGKAVLSWWKNAVLKKEPKELSVMGDQKYLEAFIPMFGENVVKILDDDIGHGAPWNYRLYVYDDFSEKGIIGWGDKKQDLVFNHFSQFSYSREKPEVSFDGGKYGHLTLGGAVFNIPEVRNMYIDYYNRLMEVVGKWL